MSNDYFFYLWRHPYTGMTCYGKSGNPDVRKRKYEGHNGFEVNWSYLVSAEKEVISQVENELKTIIQRLNVGFQSYEWISKDVDYDTIVQQVERLFKEKGATIKKVI